ncbi:MAG: hypothetical protein AB7O74_06990 [Candidatus Nanopelagicales bacterium]
MELDAPYLGQPGRHAAWLLLRRSDFCGRSLYAMLRTVGIAGDFDDGQPGWVDWQRLPFAEELLDDTRWLSGGTRATLRICVALASIDDAMDRLDERNAAGAVLAVAALADSLQLPRDRSCP